MSKVRETLLKESKEVPDTVLKEVIDFLRFLKRRQVTSRNETALLSEAALAKDWLRPQEDEAWRDL